MGKVMKTILNEIRAERKRQDAKWGGPDHDDKHHPGQWLDFIMRFWNKANNPSEPFRYRMIQIAALAVAAIESHDRKEQAKAERELKGGK